MSDQWHYRLLGEEFGPVSGELLQSLVEVGTLSEADEVRRTDTASWISVGRALSSAPSNVATAAVPAPDSTEDDAQWYCKVAGQELGPLHFDDLLKFAENGELTADEEVKFGANAKWRQVGSIGRLVSVLPYRESAALRPAQVVADAPQNKASATPIPATKQAEIPAVPQYHPAAGQPTWSAWIRGAEFGPASLVQLSQWLATGQLGPADFVRQGPAGAWLPSITVTQLLAQLTMQAAPAEQPRPRSAPATADHGPTAKPAAPSAPVVDAVETPAKPAIAAHATPAAAAAPQPKASVDKPAAEALAVRDEPKSTSPPPEPAAPRPSAFSTSSATPSAWSAPPKPVVRPPAKKSTVRSGGNGGGLIEALRQPKALGAIAIMALAVVLYFGKSLIPSGSGGDRRKVAALQQVLAEFREHRDKQASPSDWTAFTDKSKQTLDPMLDELRKTASRNYPAKQYLLWAVRDRWPEMLQNAKEKPTAAEQDFEGFLYDAAQLLGITQGNPPPGSAAARAAAAPSAESHTGE